MSIAWKFLNADRIEVVPSSRRRAWNNLMIDLLANSSRDDTYRTGVNRANVEYFDYNTPIIYEVTDENYLISSEFMNKALNRPSRTVAPIGISSLQIALVFICSVILSLIAALVPYQDNNSSRPWMTR
ncbi:PIF-6 [Operophtera brumata nucleopolyhedrovirus]|uniref:PIF-6 n=1 Tax=Operophtera brumata nucleopolyhedrovirus TaxID=1046267 RepID=A0A2H4UZR7_9ABAC|nr:PIF-6 [Operophtera brumata nucleopolyhedrovirus]AUA60293.1 PIF-6 [Operophtera brumata nucleopolyhedrovirus]